MLTLSEKARFSEYKTGTYAVGGLLKRGFDITFALCVLLVSTPLLLILFILIKMNSAGPAFYIHRRIGLNGREFGCIKFRTMHPDSDQRLKEFLLRNPSAAEEYGATAKLRNDPRIVPGIGKLLRQTSLDEVPQFLNVLKGDMSVIGPRPVTQGELEQHYGARARDVLSARPGVSGLWQVSGRNALSYAERVRLDLEYVRSWRFMSDLTILLKTVVVVVAGKGAF